MRKEIDDSVYNGGILLSPSVKWQKLLRLENGKEELNRVDLTDVKEDFEMGEVLSLSQVLDRNREDAEARGDMIDLAEKSEGEDEEKFSCEDNSTATSTSSEN